MIFDICPTKHLLTINILLPAPHTQQLIIINLLTNRLIFTSICFSKKFHYAPTKKQRDVAYQVTGNPKE